MQSRKIHIAAQVAHDYLCLQAARELTAGKTASERSEFEQPEVLASFGAFLPIRTASLSRKLSQVLNLFRKAPEIWEQFKALVGVESLKDLPRAIKDLAKRGAAVLGRIVKKMTQTLPLALYFVPKHRIGGLTALMDRLVAQFPQLKAALEKVPAKLEPIDRWMSKHIPRMKRVLTAAIFIWIWMNVAEITWDFKDLLIGFTGGLSLPQLFATFPESSIGAVFASLGVGYHLLPITLAARLMWLTAKGILKWKNDGFEVNWAALGIRQRSEHIPVT